MPRRLRVLAALLLGAGLLSLPTTAHAQTPSTTEPALVVQSGHTGPVTSLAVNPAGTLLAATEYRQNRLVLWDLRSGLQLGTLAFGQQFTAAAFQTDTRLAAGTALSTLVQFDVATGDTVRTFVDAAFGFAGLVNERTPVATRSDGLTAGVRVVEEDEGLQAYVQLWDAEGRTVAALRDAAVEEASSFGDEVTALAFSPDGATLAVGRKDGQLALWSLADPAAPVLRWSTPGELRTFAGLTGLALSPDGRLAVADGGALTLLDAATGDTLRVLHRPTDADDQGTEAAPDASEPLDPGPSETLYVVAFDARGHLLAGGRAGRLYRWAPGATAPDRKLDVGRPINALRAVPGADLAAVGAGTAIDVWDTERARRVRTLARGTTPLPPLAPLRNGQALAVIDEDRVARLWHTRTGDALYDLAHFIDDRPVRMVPAPSGRHMLLLTENEAAHETAVALIELAEYGTGAIMWESTFDGREVERVAFSPDGLYAAFLVARSQVYIVEMRTGDLQAAFPVAARATTEGSPAAQRALPRVVYDLAWLPLNGTYTLLTTGSAWEAVAPSATASLLVWNNDPEQDPEHLLSMRAPGPVTELEVSRRGRFVATAYPEGFGVSLVDLARPDTSVFLEGNAPRFAISPDEALIATGSSAGRVTLWRTDGTRLARHRPSSTAVRQVAFSDDGRTLTTATVDGMVQQWDVDPDAPEPLALRSRWFFGQGDRLLVTRDNYYTGARALLDAVAFRVGEQAYPFDAFDLVYNRPDRVLEALGTADPDRLAAYRAAYQKRLALMGLDEAAASAASIPPTVTVPPGAVPAATDQPALRLPVQAAVAEGTLDRLQVYVDDVPVYVGGGLSLRGRGLTRLDTTLTVALARGANRVQVSAANAAGAESLRATFEVFRNAPPRPSTLHLVTVGVSDYADDAYDLRYAAKDARDLADALAAAHDGPVVTHRLLDGDATRERILALRDALADTDVDDQVVVFFAGHGLLGDDLTYYFATPDLAFNAPAARGVTYAEIEGLLDGIPARRKLLLLDTCHSGEVDRTGAVGTVASDSTGTVVARAVGARSGSLSAARPAATGPDVFALLRELFADLRRGSGAVVIAAAAGVEFAYEERGNGVFTAAVLDGLRDGDADGDGTVRVSELRDYVTQQVLLRTDGRQTPTVRRENLRLDFPVAQDTAPR